MSLVNDRSSLELRSMIDSEGILTLSLLDTLIPEPADDEIIVRVEASPINPSDVGLLLGAADIATVEVRGQGAHTVVTATVPASRMRAMAGRVDHSMSVGNEGAGVVVRAGSSEAAKASIGKTVAMIGGAMFAQYRCIKLSDCLILPADATPADGASCFVNPLTSLGMVETMRLEGHTSLVHTAAASNLGRMLNRICLKDDIGLVNIVRSESQEASLRQMGAVHVCNSSAPTFLDDLTSAIEATGATLAFDAIGGGKLAGQILACMETAINRKATLYSRYGSVIHKQVYIYGGLDMRPTEINRSFGMAWSMGGWLLFPFLQEIGTAAAQRLRERVVAELKTTFASSYTREISLMEVLQPDIIARYSRASTGEKYLINPSLPLSAAS